MGTPRGRRALHQLEPLREEHADERARLDGRQAVDRAVVHAQVLRLAGLEADLDAVLAVVPCKVEHHAGDAIAATTHELAFVRRPRRAPGAAEVDGLQQVRLARTVSARDDGQAGGQLDLRRLVVTEVAQLDALQAHGPATYTFSLMGMTR